MSIKSFLARPFAAWEVRRYEKAVRNPLAYQQKVFEKLLRNGSKTLFGQDHGLDEVRTYEDFKKQVPVRDYEALKPYVEKIKSGEPDVLWPGKPKYFAKTSGTTSGTKYIPITDDSINAQVRAARLALTYYIHEKGNADFVNGKMIFIQGSPELAETGGVDTGRLSGIVHHHVPNYLLKNRLPSWETNVIEDWEEKVDAIVDETTKVDMTLFSGIPPWVLMYFERLLEKTGKKTVREVFPNFNLYVGGGVNFQPYRETFKRMIGGDFDYIETYPASEGFVAFQISQKEPDLLLHVDGGIFFEFIPADQIFNDNPERVSLKDIQLDVNYAVIINNDAGLWGYNLGDTVKFTSLKPYKLLVTGRIKHFISAFGEHVIGEEVESAIAQVADAEQVIVREFSVAPQVNPPEGELPYHEWFVDFENAPGDLSAFSRKMDAVMCEKNIYYRDLISGGILQPLKITCLQDFAFRKYMESIGKLGGQNKIPRLSDDRKIASKLEKYTLI
ncbi:MAG: GH3 auxin-responsive promoter family protein [Bacteroidetes bacterium]|nr:GH3 auxin-responsive promoter family protein [Bacteroidota bacterium]